MSLLIEQWTNGDVPIDDPEMLDLIEPNASKYLYLLKPKFPDGMNPRLEKIRADMIETSERRVAAGRKGARVRYGHVPESPEGEIPEQIGSPATSPATGKRNSPATSRATSPATSNRIAPKSIPIPTLKQISKSKSTEQNSGPITPSMWDAFKAIYPDRAGTQGFAKALKKATGLVHSGIAWSEIMAGARRYRDQQEAAGKIGTEFIKRAEYFLTAESRLWTEPYPIAAGNERTARNTSVIKDFIDAGK